MKKRLRIFVRDSLTGKLSDDAIRKGTVIRITENDVPLPANVNRILTTNFDRILEHHFVPRAIVQPETTASEPPWLAEFLLTMLLKPSHVDGVTGDLNERFASECRDLGQRRAIWRYWRRAFDSLWPLMRRAIGKALKWGAVIAAVKRLF